MAATTMVVLQDCSNSTLPAPKAAVCPQVSLYCSSWHIVRVPLVRSPIYMYVYMYAQDYKVYCYATPLLLEYSCDALQIVGSCKAVPLAVKGFCSFPTFIH